MVWCGVVWCGETINSCIVRTGTATPCVLPRSVVHSSAGGERGQSELSHSWLVSLVRTGEVRAVRPVRAGG